jgi:hypothetical protein
MFGYRCLVVAGWLAALPLAGVSQSRPSPPEPSLGDLDRELSMEPAFRNPQAVLAEAIRKRGGAAPRLPILRPEALARIGTGGGGGAVPPPIPPAIPPAEPLAGRPASLSAIPFSYEIDTTRVGSDYRDFGLPAPQPLLCHDACAADPYCKAYGYTKPGAGKHGNTPWCYLKNAVPPAAWNTCCMAGVKGVTPPVTAAAAAASTSGFTYEPDTMRQGSDYRDFGLAAAQPTLCRDACAADPYCKAYGYTKPGAGTHGSSPWCYLKNAVPNAVRNACCVVGVKTGGAAK